MDIILTRFFPIIQHRGITHSIIVITAIFVPFFIAYRKTAVPYFLAMLQHPLIGDLLTGRAQLLWPFTQTEFGLNLPITGTINIAAEWALFIASLAVMITAGDLKKFFEPHTENLILIIPTSTVLLPTFLSYPLDVPTTLLIPHAAYLAMFLTAIALALLKLRRKHQTPPEQQKPG